MRYDYRWYVAEQKSPHRTFAKDHPYAEWVWMRRWESGEVDNPVPKESAQ